MISAGPPGMSRFRPERTSHDVRCSVVMNSKAETRSGHVSAATALADAKKQGAVLAWGNFLTIVLNFLIIAFALFLAIKGINRLKTAEPPPAPAAPPKKCSC